jgi:predicted amidohydrolase
MQLDLSAVRSNVAYMEQRLDVLMSVYPWVQMVLFSELAAFGPLVVNAQPIPNETEEVFRAWARKHGIWLIPGSMFERVGELVYNTATVIDPSGEVVAQLSFAANAASIACCTCFSFPSE